MDKLKRDALKSYKSDRVFDGKRELTGTAADKAAAYVADARKRVDAKRRKGKLAAAE